MVWRISILFSYSQSNWQQICACAAINASYSKTNWMPAHTRFPLSSKLHIKKAAATHLLLSRAKKIFYCYSSGCFIVCFSVFVAASRGTFFFNHAIFTDGAHACASHMRMTCCSLLCSSHTITRIIYCEDILYIFLRFIYI